MHANAESGQVRQNSTANEIESAGDESMAMSARPVAPEDTQGALKATQNNKPNENSSTMDDPTKEMTSTTDTAAPTTSDVGQNTDTNKTTSDRTVSDMADTDNTNAKHADAKHADPNSAATKDVIKTSNATDGPTVGGLIPSVRVITPPNPPAAAVAEVGSTLPNIRTPQPHESARIPMPAHTQPSAPSYIDTQQNTATTARTQARTHGSEQAQSAAQETSVDGSSNDAVATSSKAAPTAVSDILDRSTADAPDQPYTDDSHTSDGSAQALTHDSSAQAGTRQHTSPPSESTTLATTPRDASKPKYAISSTTDNKAHRSHPYAQPTKATQPQLLPQMSQQQLLMLRPISPRQPSPSGFEARKRIHSDPNSNAAISMSITPAGAKPKDKSRFIGIKINTDMKAAPSPIASAGSRVDSKGQTPRIYTPRAHTPNNRSPRSPRSARGRGSQVFVLNKGRQASFQCCWSGCGEFVGDLMDHINTVHIGVGRAKYDCLWKGCDRGRDFDKRPSVVKHMRRHLRPLGVWFKAAEYSSLQVQSADNEFNRIYDDPSDAAQDSHGEVEDWRRIVDWKTMLVVWANVAGDFFWPAQIIDPFESPESRALCLKANAAVGCIMVRFFGTHKMTWVPESGLRPLNEGWEVQSQRSRDPLFISAVSDAKAVHDKMSYQGQAQV